MGGEGEGTPHHAEGGGGGGDGAPLPSTRKSSKIKAPTYDHDPLYRTILRKSEVYRSKRMQELSKAHRGCGVGASAIISSSAYTMAASRWAFAKAGEAQTDRGKIEFLKWAISWSKVAKELEVAAWDLSAKEGEASRAEEGDKPPAWLVPVKEVEGGQEERAAGDPGGAASPSVDQGVEGAQALDAARGVLPEVRGDVEGDGLEEEDDLGGPCENADVEGAT